MLLATGKPAELARGSVREHNGSAMPRVLVNSVPKSGTNLLASVLDVMGLQWQSPVLSHELRFHPLNYIRHWEDQDCLIGVGKSYKAKLGFLRHTLNKMDPGSYMMGHIPYQEHVCELLRSLGVRTFFVIRDPRDVVVSLLHHIQRVRSHYLHRAYAKLPSDKARLIAGIRGLRNKDGSIETQSIAEKLEVTLGWTEVETVVTLRFEDLIGERGGGTAQDQTIAIRKIGNHLGWDLAEEDVLIVGNEAFGKGKTFRRGMIGGWRGVFDDELKDAFKREAGEYLINLGYEQDNNW
jgi:hypothetical protein